MSSGLRIRLSVMMFLQYFIQGAIIPILSLYLSKHLHFPPAQVGNILAMPALAMFVAPFFVAQVADRYIHSERLLALCHVCAASLMLVLVHQVQFRWFLPLYFIYGLVMSPTMGLTNTIALHHATDAKRSFGGIRMWGTAGWCVVAWTFGYWWIQSGPDPEARLPHAFYVAAIFSIVQAFYSLTLPRSPLQKDKTAKTKYRQSWKMFAEPSLLLLCILTFVNSMVHQTYYFGMAPYLNQIGFKSQYIMPAMSIGQVSEVIVLGVLWYCIKKLGLKTTLIVGALTQAARYILFAVFPHPAVILFGLALHGICYAFFFTAGYLYVDQHSTPETRAGAQQLYTIIISGCGVLAGSLASGYSAQLFAEPQTHHVNYFNYWMVPTALGFLVALLLALFFHEAKEPILPQKATDEKQ